jgi:hypothetical protein
VKANEQRATTTAVAAHEVLFLVIQVAILLTLLTYVLLIPRQRDQDCCQIRPQAGLLVVELGQFPGCTCFVPQEAKDHGTTKAKPGPVATQTGQ